MIISQILAFSLHLYIYDIVTRANSIEELENRLHYISLSKKYNHECYKEWQTKKLPTNCILLVETSNNFIHKSPQKIRAMIKDYCKQPLNLSPLTYSTNQSLMQHTTYLDSTHQILKKYIKRYPECEHQLKKLLLDEQYKIKRDQLYRSLK